MKAASQSHVLVQQSDPQRTGPEPVNWATSSPFLVMHLLPLGLLFTGPGYQDFAWCIVLYYARMFFITAGYHRYFAHRSYKLGRVMQFLMALGGTTAVQKGPLWWAGNHRTHHRFSDTERDVHSPKHGFWWSHVGWILADRYNRTPLESIKDFAKYPELRWLDRYHLIPPLLLASACFWLGDLNGLLSWFFLSTVLLWHGTFTINSLAHVFGRRRFATSDTSKNSLILALITMGEGWHNNHHYFPPTANQGFYWWQIDLSYYVLVIMARLGLARGLRRPPSHVLERGRLGNPEVVRPSAALLTMSVEPGTPAASEAPAKA
jgi:stearoyl-CoA desaturase (delta-9 desaturase)